MPHFYPNKLVGNQTSRTIAGTAYTQSFDYDNRLLGVAGGSVSATFLYDAEGNRVKGTVAGVTTVYVAGLYEWQNGAVTKYYEGGALRRTGYATDNGVFYVVSDHLRSTSLLVNRDGTVKSRNYYYPYGGNRGGSAFSGITAKRFTGQYHEQGLPGGEGLSYYNARWYDAQVGAFISADTLVPSPLAPQTLNRYAYVGGNPLRYVDPSGHLKLCGAACEDGYNWSPPKGGGGGSGGGSNQFKASFTWWTPRSNRTSSWAYWSSQQTGMDLVSDWLYERGSTFRVYGPNAAMTRDLRRDEGIQAARAAFYKNPTSSNPPYHYGFTNPIQPIREEMQWRLGVDKSGVGRVLGGYTVYVQPIHTEQQTQVQFVVYNVMGRESGSRTLGKGPSVEGYLRGERPGNVQGFRSVWPKSIFENKQREETPLSVVPFSLRGWGGSITMFFIWTEPLQIDGQLVHNGVTQ